MFYASAFPCFTIFGRHKNLFVVDAHFMHFDNKATREHKKLLCPFCAFCFWVSEHFEFSGEQILLHATQPTDRSFLCKESRSFGSVNKQTVEGKQRNFMRKVNKVIEAEGKTAVAIPSPNPTVWTSSQRIVGREFMGVVRQSPVGAQHP